MDYKAIKDSISGNPVLLFRELLKYNPENLESLILQYNGGNSFIKEFTLANKSSRTSKTITDFLHLIFEIGYDPMRLVSYNPDLSHWGKRENNQRDVIEKYPEITALWFDLSDENQSLLLEKTGRENIIRLVSEGYYFLHYAFKQNHYKTAELLSSFGLDYSAKDNFSHSVRDYAQNNPVTLDLYLKINNKISSGEKFNGLKSWFIQNIKSISPSKYSKPEEMAKITMWLNQKWSDFTLEQKQEIFSLSIGSTTKDIYSFISQLEEDKKKLLSTNYPFWMNLDNCKVKQLAFSSVKNIHPATYNKEHDVFFVEKLANMFNNFNFREAMSHPTPKDDMARIKAFGESYAKCKDVWLTSVESGDPLFHVIAKRKNDVFRVFGNNWLNINVPKDLLGSSNSTYSYLMEDDVYSVQRHDNQASTVNVVKIKVDSIKITGLEIFKKTWMYKDSQDKYTFEYFLENHNGSICYKDKPKVLECLKDLMKDYTILAEYKKLDENKMLSLKSHYKTYIEPLYPIDAVFKLLVSCSKIYDIMSGYNMYGLDPSQVSETMRSCYNILSLPDNKDMFDYSLVSSSRNLYKVDYVLSQDLGKLALESKLNNELKVREKTKQLKL